MKRMNRREFIGVLGGASAVSMAGLTHAFAGNNTVTALDAASTTALHVTGIMMIDLENPEVVRLGFPKTPGHHAKLSIVPLSGAKRFVQVKGHGAVEGTFAASEAKTFPPEMVRAREIYGNGVKSRVDRCPNIITIPSSAIRSISAAKLTKNRWTFVRADNNREVNTFRPRQVAETIRFDLSSAGVLKLDGDKANIALNTVKELWFENTPNSPDGMGTGYPDHFAAYFSYIERPAALDFEVVPKKVGATSSPAPKGGHHFMMMVDAYTVCAPLAVP